MAVAAEKLEQSRPSSMPHMESGEKTNLQSGPDRSLATPMSGLSLSSMILYAFSLTGLIGCMVLYLNNTVRFPLWVLLLSTVMFLSIGVSHYLHSRHLTSRSQRYHAQLKQRLEEIHDRNWELQESEERYRGLAEAFGDMILHRDANGKIIYVNDAVANGFNSSRAAFIGKQFKPVILEEIHQTGHAYPAIIREIKIKMADGERWLAWFDLPMRDEVTGENSIRSVARDITKQKETEIKLRAASAKAQAASEAKSRFLANVSHEMRTPLNGILGMSGLLSDTKLSAEQETYVDAVHNSGAALLSLIEDILDMSLIEAGKIVLKREPVELTRLLEDVSELLSSRAHEKGITISSFISNAVPGRVETDAGRLRQVMVNLIGNALKFTEKGGVYTEITAMPVDEKNKTVRLKFTVQDTGPGISKEHQSLIFDEFSQSDTESTRKHGGAGLGLTISQRIVDAMGGKINVSSELGSGSQFSFEIDLSVLEAAEDKFSSQLEGQHICLAGLPSLQEKAISNYIGDFGGSYEFSASLGAIETYAQSNALLMKHDPARPVEQVISALNKGNIELKNTIVLLEPEQRNLLEQYKANGIHNYLIEPVRGNSLLRMLLGTHDEDATHVASSEAKKWAAPIANSSTSKNILLAEDNDINAMLASTILQKAGHRVSRVMNGEEAFGLWNEKRLDAPFDLVLMDLQMPIMDGLDSLKTIREFESENALSVTPIFILTADEQPESREKAKINKASGFLTKPLAPEKLLQTIVDI